MKKIILALMVAGITFYACKKDNEGNATVPVVSKPISPDSAQLLSDSLQLSNFKISTKGTLPAKSGTAITLEGYQDSVVAVNGGYAIILPHITNGIASGYYVQVKGANTFMTVDFKQSLNRKKAAAASKGLLARMQAVGNDSLIAIKLPFNILPGTFIVQYEAYDSVGNVSDTASIVVRVLTNDQTSADFSLLQGKWNFYSETGINITTGATTYSHVENYGPDSTFTKYVCVDNKLSPGDDGKATVLNPSSINQTIENSLTFTKSNKGGTTYSEKYSTLNVDSSSCSTLVYTPGASIQYTPVSYHYDSATKQLTLISDGDGGIEFFYAQVYTVPVLTASRLEIVTNGADHNIFTR